MNKGSLGWLAEMQLSEVTAHEYKSACPRSSKKSEKIFQLKSQVYILYAGTPEKYNDGIKLSD